jgi:hypothetical protein
MDEVHKLIDSEHQTCISWTIVYTFPNKLGCFSYGYAEQFD